MARNKRNQLVATKQELLPRVTGYIEAFAEAEITFLLRHKQGGAGSFIFTVNGDCDLAKHLFPEFDVLGHADGNGRYAVLELEYYL